jgi:hypothetical protein
MPAHPRQQIREAVTAALLNQTAAGSRVYETRVVPWKKAELPALAVYSLSEEVLDVSEGTAPRELKRVLRLAVEGAVWEGQNVDDAVDALSSEVEAAMHADPTFGVASVGDAILEGTEIEVSDEGDKLVGFVRWTYRVTYYTMAPGTAAVDDFKRAGTTYEVGDGASDVVEVPT